MSCLSGVGTSWGLCRAAVISDQSGSVAGAVHGDDIFVAGPREGALLKIRWRTRDQLTGPGPGPGDQKELHIRNRTPRCCRDGLVFAADVRHANEVIEELGLAMSKPVHVPVVVDDTGITQTIVAFSTTWSSSCARGSWR